ncbi:hypothetical protein D3C73_1339900 [compost metagenome]
MFNIVLNAPLEQLCQLAERRAQRNDRKELNRQPPFIDRNLDRFVELFLVSASGFAAGQRSYRFSLPDSHTGDLRNDLCGDCQPAAGCGFSVNHHFCLLLSTRSPTVPPTSL